MNSPPEIAKAYCAAGIKKANTSPLKTFILSCYAGIFIGSGGVVSAIASYNEGDGLSRFLSGLVFPIGLMLVLCAGAELFTGNCLLVIPLLEKKITIGQMLLSWLIVYIGNFFGSIFTAVLVVYGHIPDLYKKALANVLVNTASSKCQLSFGDAFVKGVWCNFFVCLAVWVAFGAKELSSKIIGLWTPILLFIVCGYEHSVANMYFIPAGLFASYEYGIKRIKLNWGRLFYKNLIPVTLGNIVGGSLLVGIGYWFVYLYTPTTNEENKNQIKSDSVEVLDAQKEENK